MTHSANDDPSQPLQVLLVEDNAMLLKELTDGLTTAGLVVSTARNGREALRAVRQQQPGIVVLDVMLPDISGFDLCRAVRSKGFTAPILMLTARDAIEDRVEGLDAGADDYLIKPFALRELIARLRALARRRTLLARRIRIADLEVDLGAKRARRGGRIIELTTKEFALLECFALNQDVVLDRASITSHVWDDNHDAFTNVLEVLVGRLRRKIDSGFEPKLIHTMRGTGYRFGI